MLVGKALSDRPVQPFSDSVKAGAKPQPLAPQLCLWETPLGVGIQPPLWGADCSGHQLWCLIPCSGSQQYSSLCLGHVGSLRAFLSTPPVSLQGQMVDVSQVVWVCGGEFQGGEFSLDLPAQNQCRQNSFDVTALSIQPVSCMLQSGCQFLQQVEGEI